MKRERFGPGAHLLRLAEVMKRTQLGRTTIYRWRGEKRPLEAISFSPRCTRWIEPELDAWVAGKAST